MRSGVKPATDLDREPTTALEAEKRKNKELTAALEAEKKKNMELEQRMKRLRKSREEAQHERNVEKKNRECLQEELNMVSAMLVTERAESERLRDVAASWHEKCSSADTELEVSRKCLPKLRDQAVRMERVVEAFRNGSKFENLRNMYESEARRLHTKIRKLNSELVQAERTLVTMRKNWEGVFDDMLSELNRECKDHDRAMAHRDKREEQLDEQIRKLREDLRKKNAKTKQAKDTTAELENKIAKLERRVNMDQSNSGITSAGSELAGNRSTGEPETSDEAEEKKAKTNSRKKSDRKPGGQPGHEGHGRKRLDADIEIILPIRPEIDSSPDWVKTGQEKRRQVVGIRLEVYATDYVSEQYQNVHTGELYSPAFPEDVRNEVNYADDLRAALLYLTHYCNVSNDKARLFLSDISGGALHVSHGFVDGLGKYFSKKVGARRQEIFDNLVKARSVHADFTVGKLNGKRAAIGICSDGKDNVLYIMNHSKGHEAAKLLPIKNALVLITNREATFLNDYGIHHQICLEHLRRDLNDVLQNDPDRQWAKEMRDLLCTLWDKRRGLPKEERRMHERTYDEILNLTEKEYAKKPARKSLPQGPNLVAALRKLKKHVLYFLRHPWIPPDNSEAERRARLWKRKQHQCVTFRSDDGIIAACDFLTIVTTAHQRGKNIFDELLTIFGEPMPTPDENQAA